MSEKKTVEVTLITGRTVDQGVAIEGGKLTQSYVKAAAVCYMDPNDMKKIGVITGDIVTVKTNFGQIIVRVVKSEDTPHVGIAFIPMGPWANQVVNPETDSIGMPSFRGMNATIEPSQGSKIMDAATLVRTAFKKF
ncbi:MAG: molybdopterin dinucleotide binding domain-containing protein [Candidatus Atabeyarchaeum deiterrae]